MECKSFKQFRSYLIERSDRHAAYRLLEELLQLDEESSFYIYRTDTNAVLARGVQGFEAAKTRASQLRKTLGLKWDQVRFKSERMSPAPPTGGLRFGISPDGRSFTNASGHSGRVEYSRNFNPSKGRRFRG